jgi:hypothetical protein
LLGLGGALVAAFALGAAPRAVAQTAASRTACPRCTIVGDGPEALPAIFDVPVARLAPPVSGAITGLGGFGLSMNDVWANSQRFRVLGSIAGAIHVTEWLALGARIHGQWETVDRGGGRGGDTGLVGYPTIFARATVEPAEGLGLAADLAGWMYGGEAPSFEPASTSMRLRGIVSYQIAAGDVFVTLSGTGGIVLDNSRAAAPLNVTDALSEEDRVSLGVSDYHAAVIGLGFALRWQALEVLAEVTDRLLVGSPDLGRSPLHVVFGARVRPAGEILELGLLADVRASSASAAMIGGTRYEPVDPTFSIYLTTSIRLGTGSEPAVEPPPPDLPPDVPPDVPPPATTGRVSGRVVDDAGAPVSGAQIELVPTAAEGAEPLRTTSDADGRWSIDEAPLGPARVTIRVEGREPIEQTIEVGAGATVDVPVALPASLPRGEIRGVVQGYDGRPLEAQIRISPLGLELTCDADGAFEAEVPPGEYDVEIRAPSHRSQTRHVAVEEQGVVVLNAQLRRARD